MACWIVRLFPMCSVCAPCVLRVCFECAPRIGCSASMQLCIVCSVRIAMKCKRFGVKWGGCSTASGPPCKSGPNNNVKPKSKRKPITFKLSLHWLQCCFGGQVASFCLVAQQCDNLNLVCSSWSPSPSYAQFQCWW